MSSKSDKKDHPNPLKQHPVKNGHVSIGIYTSGMPARLSADVYDSSSLPVGCQGKVANSYQRAEGSRQEAGERRRRQFDLTDSK